MEGDRPETSEDPVVEPPEILGQYLRRQPKRGQRESAADVAEKIDWVSPKLVGRIDVVKLYKVAPRCARIGLALAMPSGWPKWPDRLANEPGQTCSLRPTNRGGAAVVTLNDAEAARRLERRGEPRNQHLSPTALLVAERLCTDMGLYERVDSRDLDGTDWANMFFIEKRSSSSVKYRVIVDARRANSRVNKAPYGFELFTLDALINVIGELSLRRDACNNPCPVYFASADSRHHFHQIPLYDDEKRKQFYLQGENGQYFLPKTFIMGWTLAPIAGQCVTWGMLLSSEEDGKLDLGKHSGLTDEAGLTAEARAALQGDRPPAWLPLEGGGGIFVIIDNIFVVSPHQKVRDYWARRIIVCSNRFNLRLKDSENPNDDFLDGCPKYQPNGPPPRPGVLNSGERYGPVEVGALRADSPRSVKFMGIEFSGSGRRVCLDAEPEAAPGTLDSVTGLWSGTHRELWSWLGVLLWWRRVAGLDSFERNDDMQLTRRLYATHSPQPGAPRSEWSAPAELSPADSECLARLWRERAADEFTPYRRVEPVAQPWFGACDASLTSGRGMLGIVGFGAFPADAVPEANVPVSHETEQHHHDHIALAELEAIRRTVELGARVSPRNCTLFVIASDNTNAIRWTQRRYARNTEGNNELSRLYAALGQRRLLLVYVPSAANVADNASRGDRSCDPARTRATWSLLREAYQCSGARSDQPGLGQAEVARAGGGAAAHGSPNPGEDRRRQRGKIGDK